MVCWGLWILSAQVKTLFIHVARVCGRARACVCLPLFLVLCSMCLMEVIWLECVCAFVFLWAPSLQREGWSDLKYILCDSTSSPASLSPDIPLSLPLQFFECSFIVFCSSPCLEKDDVTTHELWEFRVQPKEMEKINVGKQTKHKKNKCKLKRKYHTAEVCILSGVKKWVLQIITFILWWNYCKN